MRFVSLLFACVLLAPAAALQKGGPVGREDAGAISTLGRLWYRVRIFHPWLAHRPIDWNRAFEQHLHAARGADGTNRLIGSLRAMLAELHDPLTRVQEVWARPAEQTTAATKAEREGCLVVTLQPREAG